MAVATVFLIPEKAEPIFWLFIFIFSAYVIAKTVSKNYFLHGFCVSLVNCIWITAAHIIFYSTYITNHPNAIKMSANMPYSTHPRAQMLVMGPIFGIGFGLVLGFFAFIASLIVKKKARTY